MNSKKIISSITIGAGAVILGLGLQYALASWTPAPASPPSSNVAAPINVGSGAQAKAGAFSVGTTTLPSGYSFGVTGGASIDALLTQAFTLANGTQGAGKVLTSDANGVGTWQAAASGGSNAIVFLNPAVLATVNGDGNWYTISSLASDGVPAGASEVILGTELTATGGVTGANIYLRTNAGGNTYQLSGGNSAGGGAPYISNFSQGIYPISSSGTFDYQSVAGTSGSTITLMGYVGPAPSSLSVSGMTCKYSISLQNQDVYTFTGSPSGGVTPYSYFLNMYGVPGGGFAVPNSDVPGVDNLQNGFQESGSSLTVTSGSQAGTVNCSS